MEAKARTYRAYGKDIVVTDPYVLDVVERTERLEMSPGEARRLLKDYLIYHSPIGMREFCERLSLLGVIMSSFINTPPGRTMSVSERYAEKHDLTGTFYPCPGGATRGETARSKR